MNTRKHTIAQTLVAAVASLLFLFGCGKHDMDAMHTMDMKKDSMSSTSMDGAMKKDSHTEMGEDTMMDDKKMMHDDGMKNDKGTM